MVFGLDAGEWLVHWATVHLMMYQVAYDSAMRTS